MIRSMQIRVQRLFLVLLTTRNWPRAIAVWLGLLPKSVIRFRNDEQFELSKATWIKYLENVYLFYYFPKAKISNDTITINYKNIDLTFKCGPYGWGTVLEIFAGNPYREFFDITDLKGKTVLDVGAALGDTALLFLLAGAERVYAVEAFPSFYQLANENIASNGFSSHCEILLSAVGGSAGILRIDENLEEMFGVGIQEKEIGTEVPIVTLEQLVLEKGLSDVILKLDVEGYEYDILLNTPKKTLRVFSDMVIEYHYGYEKLTTYLKEAGYHVSYTDPQPVTMSHFFGDDAKNMWVGNIYAKRIDEWQ